MKKSSKKNTAKSLKHSKKQRKKQLKSSQAPIKTAPIKAESKKGAPKKVTAPKAETCSSTLAVAPLSVPEVQASSTAPTSSAVTPQALPSDLPSSTSVSPNRAAFFCFLAIFACMLLFESTRFRVYFDRESGEYPFLRPVGETISLVAQKSGIESFMEGLGQWTKALSQEFLVVADKDMASQWQGAKEFYASVLGLQSNAQAPEQSESQGSHESQKQVDAGALEFVAEPLAEKQQEPQGATPVEGATDTPVMSKAQQALATQEELTQPENSTPIEPVEQVAPVQLSNPPNPITKKYAYYDATRLTAAPSPEAVEEYLTLLPDYGKKVKVLLIGDSMMMEGLGPTLQKSLRKRKDVEVIREGRYSSGLSKPDFFNWPENLKKLLQKHDPHVLIISLGANDTQDIMVGKRRFQIDTDGWERVYAIRVLNFLEQATENNRQVLWISLPVMTLMPYATRTKLINAITAHMASFYPAVHYENIEHLLTKDGKFASFIQDKNNKTIRLRSKDKIHVSTAGGQMLTDYVLPGAHERVERVRMQEVGQNPFIPVAGKANHIHFTSALRQKMAEYVVYLPESHASSTQAGEKSTLPMGIAAVQAVKESAKTQMTVPSLVQLSLQGNAQVQDQTSFAQKNKERVTKVETFPVLYLLHGATSRANDWNKYMGKDLQSIANEKRVIIVAPTTEEFGWYVDSSKIAKQALESFVMQELLSHVETLFPTNGQRALAGLSMGGHGAMTLGFKYPKTFSSVASVSGVLDIRLHPEQWQLAKVLGEYEQHKNEWNKNSAVYLMEKSKKNAYPKQILISTGLQDSAVLEDTMKAKEMLEKKKIPFEYTELEGAHTWDFWKQEIPRILRKQAEFLQDK